MNQPQPGRRWRRAKPLLLALLLALAAGGLAGCRGGAGRLPDRPEPDFTARTAVYQRATSQVGRVVLGKPLEGQGQGNIQKFTPLILQELAPADALAVGRDFWGALPGDGATNRVVYAREQTIALPGGRRHSQVTYLWLYPPQKEVKNALPCQGVRLTLNAAGQPVIWEMLAAINGLREIYVAGSVEHGAWQRHQNRRPGRRHFVEPATADWPEVITPLILEDSAELFGPMVFLSAGSRSPHAVLCRCMPAPARAISGMVYYEIRPWPENWRDRIRRRPDHQALRALIEAFEQHQAVDVLRLPEAW